MPIFRDDPSPNRTAENRLSAENGVMSRFFLQKPQAQSGCKKGIGRSLVVFLNAEHILPSKARCTMGCGPSSKSADPTDAGETGR
jgi:hypothetical protein